MNDVNKHLERYLLQIRRRYSRLFHLEGMLRFSEICMMGFLIFMLLLTLGVPVFWLRAIFFMAIASFAGLAIYKFHLFPKKHKFGRDIWLSGKVEKNIPELKNKFSSAYEFSTTIDSEKLFSKDLSKASVKETADLLKNDQIKTVVPYLPLRKFVARNSFFIVLLIAIAVIWPSSLKSSWMSLWGDNLASSLYSGEVAFLAGDINLSYSYPTYTGLEPLVVKNSSGEIEAYPGTQITLEVNGIKDFDEAMLRFKSGANVALTKSGSKSFKGNFTVLKEGSYNIQFDGVPDSRTRKVKLIKDREPVVVLSYPPEELEVRETDRIELEYRLEDDFGLQDIELVVNYDTKEGREEKRVNIETFAKNVKSNQDSWIWELSTMSFLPGDSVSYFLEAKDNDTVNGPKVGRSTTHTLKVFSVHDQHNKILEKQERLWESMLELLAKYLENTVKEAKLQTMAAVLKFVSDSIVELREVVVVPLSELVVELEDDPLASDSVREMLNGMSNDFNRHLIQYLDLKQKFEHYSMQYRDGQRSLFELEVIRAQSIARFEKYIVELYELLKKQKYDALVAESESLADMRDKLRSMLEEYKQTGDKVLKKKISDMLKKFREKLNEMMAKMSDISKELPENFVNMEAMNSDKMNKDLESIEQMLENGDLESALEQLENMSQQLNEMLDEMKKGSENLGESMYSEDMKKLMDFMKDLDQTLEKEKQLHKMTEEQYKKYQEKMQEMMKQNLDKMLEEVDKDIADAKEELEKVKSNGNSYLEKYKDNSLTRLEDLKKALQAKDVQGSLEIGKQARIQISPMMSMLKMRDVGRRERERLENLDHTNKSMAKLSDAMKKLEEMMPNPQKMLSPEQQQMLQKMSQQQQRLAQEGQKLRRDIEEMGGNMPFMPGESGQQISQALEGMQKSRQQLQRMQPGKAEGHQQQAIYNLDQIKQGMQNAMQQMQNGMKYGGMRPQMPGGKGKKKGQGRKFSQEKVAIPKAGEYKAPSELREDILEAMKKKAPKSYQPQTKEYYKELVK